MVTAYQAAAVGFPNRKLQFRYDYLGRRVQKLVFDQGSGQLVYGRRFLYEGWNLIAEFADTGVAAIAGVVRSYTWGLDIARSLTEANGVNECRDRRRLRGDGEPDLTTYAHLQEQFDAMATLQKVKEKTNYDALRQPTGF